MKLVVGSTNPTKVAAVEEIAKQYPMFAGAEVRGLEVPVETFGHPKSLAETVDGAIHRAKSAFQDCDYGFGLESGLLPVPHSRTGFMEVTVCAIFDGERFYMGLSPGYEWPVKVTEIILQGLDGSQAMREAGLTDHEKVGAAKGAIDLLTNGKMNRTEFNVIAITMAMIQLENKAHY